MCRLFDHICPIHAWSFNSLFQSLKEEAFLTEGLQVLLSFSFIFMKSPLKFEIQILTLISIRALITLNLVLPHDKPKAYGP